MKNPKIVQALTRILKPFGFYKEKDQMKEIFLTGNFSNLPIENLDFEEKDQILQGKTPFLPRNSNETQRYSLLLELEGVLLISAINEENELFLRKRPFLDDFMQEMSIFFEIIVFSSNSKEDKDDEK